jgi:hypothetical protein
VEEVVRRMTPVLDRVNLGLIVGTVLALMIAVDPPFGFGPLRIVASLIAGALLSLIVSRYYSRRASEELRSEAERLRKQTNLILRAMHNTGFAEITWDEHGEPEGMVIKLSGAAEASGGMSGKLTVGREEDHHEGQ